MRVIVSRSQAPRMVLVSSAGRRSGATFKERAAKDAAVQVQTVASHVDRFSPYAPAFFPWRDG